MGIGSIVLELCLVLPLSDLYHPSSPEVGLGQGVVVYCQHHSRSTIHWLLQL